MTQSQLAEQVGVKFQQLQKYESGANRVSASRLWHLARALDVQVAEFFDHLPRESAAKGVPDEAAEVVRLFDLMPEAQRDAILYLARRLAGESEQSAAE